MSTFLGERGAENHAMIADHDNHAARGRDVTERTNALGIKDLVLFE